jgi:hypothetical protein
MTIRVLYDGYPLIYAPESPAALHLWALLARLPDEVEPVVALPEDAPVWLPADLSTHIVSSSPAARDPRKWAGRVLGAVQEQVGARLVHLTHDQLPFSGAQGWVISPAKMGVARKAHKGFLGTLREALSVGGMVQAGAIAYPEEIPRPEGDNAVMLPTVVHPDFVPNDDLPDLASDDPIPEMFVLYHGPQDARTLRFLMDLWTWAAGPVGEAFPLVMVGLSSDAQVRVRAMADELSFGETVLFTPPQTPPQLAMLYQRASAVLHPADASPWGSALVHGLACARPIVGLETPRNSAIVGSGAYLTALNTREMGAALLSVLVMDDEVGRNLSAAAEKRATTWNQRGFGSKLLTLYERVLGV